MLFGLDIGGTNLKAVKVTPTGEIVDSATVPAGGTIPRNELLKRASDTLRSVAGDDRPQHVGIAFGGMIQPDGTMRLGSTNLPNLADLPLVDAFSDCLAASCTIDHDARAAMRGEAWLGAAHGAQNAMTVTFGTGIGAGLLLGGRIHAGAHGGAGEIGVWRLIPPPDADTWPSVEDIAAPAQFAARRGVGFSEAFHAWIDRDSATAGDDELDEVFELVGRMIANAHLLLDLEVVVLIGAVTALGEPFRRAIESSFLAACPAGFPRDLAIRLGTLGPLAGAVGAAALHSDEAQS